MNVSRTFATNGGCSLLFEEPKSRHPIRLQALTASTTDHVPCTENDSEVLFLGVELRKRGPGVLLLGLRRLRIFASAL